MTLFRERAELLVRFRAGERDALHAVYVFYVDLVAALVRRFTGGHAGWQDLVQECFMRAFSESARMRFDGVREYRPFLVTLCRNVLIDWARRKGREVPTEDFDTVAETPKDVSEAWDDPAVMTAVEAYLATLPPELSRVHAERFVHNHTQEQAAAALGLTRQKVRTLEAKLQRGLKKFLQSRGLLR